eukprot:COSAG02_NODE_68012_length_251_cov_1.144737_1_plen_57_part_10
MIARCRAYALALPTTCRARAPLLFATSWLAQMKLQNVLLAACTRDAQMALRPAKFAV